MLIREVLAAADRLGLSTVSALARQNLGVVLARLGRLAEARALEERAVGELQAHGDRRLEAASRCYLSAILAELGEAAAAEREAVIAVGLTATTPPSHALALATLAEVELARGAVAAAGEHSGAAMAILDALGGLDEGDATVRLVRARVLALTGPAAAARAAARAARERLLMTAEKIGDARWRRSFLENVAENRATLELAERLA
jgi:hypothetical protein